MTYEDAKNKLMKGLIARLGNAYTVEIKTIEKNNGCKREAFEVKSESSKVASILYFDEWINCLISEEKVIDVAVEELFQMYMNNRMHDEEAFDECMNFEKIKNRIVYRLINFDKNRELLLGVPHLTYLDLAIVYYVVVSVHEKMDGAYMIRNEHLDTWGISVNELRMLAEENTPKLLKAECVNMKELLMGSSVTDIDTLDDEIPMYVLSNNRKSYGAACILYPDMLKKIADRLGDDCYVIPSSLHETILIPASGMEAASLSEMIMTVNETALAKEDVLAEHPYFYSRDNEELVAA